MTENLSRFESQFQGIIPSDETDKKETEKRLSQGINYKEAKRIHEEKLDKLWGFLPDPNYRFQLFSICVHYNNEKPCKLYGAVEIDGSGYDSISLFNRGPRSSKPIHNKGLVPLTGLTAVPATKYINITSQLFVIDDEDEDANEDDDEEEEEERAVLNECVGWHMAVHRHSYFDSCASVVSNAKYGHSVLYYVLLDRAAEASMEVSFNGPRGRNVVGKIAAYYGKFRYNCTSEEEKYYELTLFEAESEVLLETGKIPLMASMFAVPYYCSLIIEARLWDDDTLEDIVYGFREFDAQPKGSATYCIEGNGGFNLDLKVDWKYAANRLEL